MSEPNSSRNITPEQAKRLIDARSFVVGAAIVAILLAFITLNILLDAQSALSDKLGAAGFLVLAPGAVYLGHNKYMAAGGSKRALFRLFCKTMAIFGGIILILSIPAALSQEGYREEHIRRIALFAALFAVGLVGWIFLRDANDLEGVVLPKMPREKKREIWKGILIIALLMFLFMLMVCFIPADADLAEDTREVSIGMTIATGVLTVVSFVFYMLNGGKARPFVRAGGFLLIVAGGFVLLLSNAMFFMALEEHTPVTAALLGTAGGAAALASGIVIWKVFKPKTKPRKG